ncbi:MAG: DUF2157 domain-containing protein [Deltaproteobacteria bacterium]|nr:DUF2157 domain-containing protein [Deltaproteobacteria bacterium]
MQIADVANRRADAGSLFLLGFGTLFLELALIRFLAGNIWNLGYFPNLVLIGVFTGLGLGFLLHRLVPDRLSPSFVALAFGVLLSLTAVIFHQGVDLPGFDLYHGDVGGELYFSFPHKEDQSSSFLPFLICFASVVAVFGLLAQKPPSCFNNSPR